MLTLEDAIERASVLTLADERLWAALADAMPDRDLAFTPRFARVYEEKGDGRAECFVFESGAGRVLYPYIRRSLASLPFATGDLARYSDIWTPYCYGGFVHDARPDEAPSLLRAFRRAFESHARATRIVTEFIRFNPLIGNHAGAAPFFDRWIRHRDNVVIDLAEDESALFEQCRKSYRNCIRQARRAGLELCADDPRESAAAFADLYRRTMQRHGQDGYLDFDRAYFDTLFRQLGPDMQLVSVRRGAAVLARAIFLQCGDYLDYFLAGSESDAFDLFPNHFLIWEMALRAKAQGLRHLHLGGGRDSLYFFKRGFSAHTAPFYIAGKVHLPETYAILAARRATATPPLDDVTRRFFPAHRAGYE